MTCDDIQLLLPDLDHGRLSPAETLAVQRHLKHCPACSHALEQQRQLDRAISHERTPAPGPRVSAAFHAWLDTEIEKAAPKPIRLGTLLRWRDHTWFMGALTAAAACVVFATGILLGTKISTERAVVTTTANTASELHELRTQVASMREAMAWTVLQQVSANERLKTVLALDEKDTRPSAVNELLGTLTYDANANVRISAAEALYRHIGQPTVKTAVARALAREPSPVVQLALIDLLATTRDPIATNALQNFARNDSENEFVRAAATRALTRL